MSPTLDGSFALQERELQECIFLSIFVDPFKHKKQQNSFPSLPSHKEYYLMQLQSMSNPTLNKARFSDTEMYITNFDRAVTTALNLNVPNFAHSTLIYSHTLTPSHSQPSHSHPHTQPSHSHPHTHTSHLHTAGTASHSLDYRKAAGAFIHGFRYTGTVL